MREDSLITVGQVKVFWQTAHRTAVFNSNVRGKKSEESTQADQSLATSLSVLVTVCQTFAMLSLVNVKICHFLWSSMTNVLQC